MNLPHYTKHHEEGIMTWSQCYSTTMPISSLREAKGGLRCSRGHMREKGELEAARVLLAHRADPDISNDNDWTSLVSASYSGHLDIVRLLLQNGAKVDLPNDDGWTPSSRRRHTGKINIWKLRDYHSRVAPQGTSFTP